MFFGILSFLIWPILIIGVIGYFVRRNKKSGHPATDTEWYLQFALSKEDAVSQLFLLLSVFFFGVTLLAFNKNIGDPFSWRIILFITSVLALLIAYYFKALYSLAVGLMGVTGWWGAQAAEWMQGKDIKTSVMVAGLAFIALLLYVLGHLHEKEIKWKRFALVYLILGIIPITGALFFFSSKPGLSELGAMTKGALFISSWQITTSLVIFLAALVGVMLAAAAKRLLSFFECLAVLGLMLVFGAIALLPEQHLFLQQAGNHYDRFYSGGQALSNSGVLWAVMFNVLAFFELLGLIFSAYSRRETWLINLGALFLFLRIIMKYFDWFFTFLDKSIFFIGAGILLVALGWFMEKGRRLMISTITPHGQ